MRITGLKCALLGENPTVRIHKLLGGKVRDRIRVHNGGVRQPMTGWNPEDYARAAAFMKAAPEGFTIVKEGVAFPRADGREDRGILLR